MGGFVQTVDVSVELSSEDPLSLPSNPTVVEAEIDRVFGGGGSQAEVDVIFDGLLTEEEKEELQSRIPNKHSGRGILDRPEDEQRRQDINIQVDVTIGTPLVDGPAITKRLFTGTVTKITENNERVVTLHALDRRLQLNRNTVMLDIGDGGAETTSIVRNILSGMDSGGDGLGWKRGEDYEFGVVSSERIYNQSWGVDTHTTAFEVLQDITRIMNGSIHIDQHNVVHFVGYPDGNTWGSESLPPVIEWESGDEESETEVVVESTYDETGLGAYAVVGQDALETTRENEDISTKVTENNVISRGVLENVAEYESIREDILRNSGTIRVAGDPRIRPYDMIEINEEITDGFAPIAHGKFMTKEVRHIIGGSEGYITEIELGKNPEELFEAFTKGTGTGDDITTESELQDKEMHRPFWDATIGRWVDHPGA